MTDSDDAARRVAVNAAIVAAAGIGVGRGAYQVLVEQAKIARRVIPKPTTRPFDGDGLYRPGAVRAEPWRPGMHCDIHLMVFGDSIAAGLGADTVDELPGVLLARGLAEESGRDVRLSVKAIVGATSVGLSGQIDAMRVAGGSPDISVILVGGNDITARHAIGPSARRVGEAVGELVAAGSKVVVGTCPDLGIIKPVPQPLRSVMHTWSLRLGAAQAAQVRRHGGVPVSLAETLAPEFHERGESLFSPDRFHPNSAGYELAAGLLLPAVCTSLGVWAEQEPGVSEAGAPESEATPQDAPETGAAETDAPETDPVDASEARESVVGRLVHRLTTFVRTHEGEGVVTGDAADADRGGTGSGRTRHTEAVESAQDPADARRAADQLRRRSRTLRRGGAAGGDTQG